MSEWVIGYRETWENAKPSSRCTEDRHVCFFPIIAEPVARSIGNIEQDDVERIGRQLREVRDILLSQPEECIRGSHGIVCFSKTEIARKQCEFLDAMQDTQAAPLSSPISNCADSSRRSRMSIFRQKGPVPTPVPRNAIKILNTKHNFMKVIEWYATDFWSFAANVSTI